VGQRRQREAAVAPTGAEADGLGFEQDDVAPRVVGRGVQRGPQAGEPAADNAQVSVDAAGQCRLRVAGARGVEPEGLRLRVRVGGALGGVRRSVGPGRRDGAGG
jgi:hypothetical protein